MEKRKSKAWGRQRVGCTVYHIGLIEKMRPHQKLEGEELVK